MRKSPKSIHLLKSNKNIEKNMTKIAVKNNYRNEINLKTYTNIEQYNMIKNIPLLQILQIKLCNSSKISRRKKSFQTSKILDTIQFNEKDYKVIIV